MFVDQWGPGGQLGAMLYIKVGSEHLINYLVNVEIAGFLGH